MKKKKNKYYKLAFFNIHFYYCFLHPFITLSHQPLIQLFVHLVIFEWHDTTHNPSKQHLYSSLFPSRTLAEKSMYQHIYMYILLQRSTCVFTIFSHIHVLHSIFLTTFYSTFIHFTSPYNYSKLLGLLIHLFYNQQYVPPLLSGVTLI